MRKVSLIIQLFLIVFLIPIKVFAFSSVEDIPESEVLAHLSLQNNSLLVPDEFSISVWNAHKNDPFLDFKIDFTFLAKTDFILLQESMNDYQFPIFLRTFNLFDTWMAQSFRYLSDDSTTGVATLSKYETNKVYFLRSPNTEPILNTSKMTLITDYQFANGRKLRILNIHAINFVTTEKFKNQIKSLRSFIENFDGSIILAGDFNTWNSNRMQFLLDWAEELDLSEVDFMNDFRTMRLDHLFIKGCRVIQAQVLNELKSSDHYPLEANLNCQAPRK